MAREGVLASPSQNPEVPLGLNKNRTKFCPAIDVVCIMQTVYEIGHD